jgi:hypothetical protein
VNGSARRLSLVVGLVGTLFCTSCVPANSARNWVPQTSEVDAAYYQCAKEASPAGPTNVELLKSCMQAAGYQKRPATAGETAVGWLTAPLWVPFCLALFRYGGTCFANL